MNEVAAAAAVRNGAADRATLTKEGKGARAIAAARAAGEAGAGRKEAEGDQGRS
jgi:hypothetical protein